MKANVIIGNGVPESTIGNDGEYYADFNTSLIYGPKTAGEWGQGVPFTEFEAATAEVPIEAVAEDVNKEGDQNGHGTMDTAANASAADSTVVVSPLQGDIQKIEANIAALKADGAELFKDEIASLEEKRDQIKAEIAKTAKAVTDDVKNAVSEVETVTESIVTKYGPKAWELAKAISIGFIIYQLVK